MSSVYADHGTAAHSVLEECLQLRETFGTPAPAASYIGHSITVADGPHGVMSPSGAKRWMNCPGSVQASIDFPELPQPPREVVITEEDAIAVQQCLDYVEQRRRKVRLMEGVARVFVFSERRISLEKLIGNQDSDGTSDVAILGVDDDGEAVFLEHVDYKHGSGVAVDVDDPQNDMYWLGSICAEADEKTPAQVAAHLTASRLTIVQPRCDKIEPRIRWRDIDKPLDHFRATLVKLQTAHAVRNSGEFEAGEWCRFCPIGGSGGVDGRPVCAAYTRHVMAAAGVISEDDILPETADAFLDFAARDTRLLSVEQIIGVLDARDAISGALNAIEAWALELLQQPEPPARLLERYKPVRGRSQRRWANEDEDALVKALKRFKIQDGEKERALGKKDLFEEKLKGPAPIERLLKAHGTGMDKKSAKWLAFQQLIEKPLGRVTIAPIEDPRPSVRPEPADADELFGELSNEVFK